MTTWTCIKIKFPDGRAKTYGPDEFGNAAQHHQRDRAVASKAFTSSGFCSLTGCYYPGRGGPFEDATHGGPMTNAKMVAKVQPGSNGHRIAYGDALFNGVETEFVSDTNPSKSYTVRRCDCDNVVTLDNSGTPIRSELATPRHLPAGDSNSWKESGHCRCSSPMNSSASCVAARRKAAMPTISIDPEDAQDRLKKGIDYAIQGEHDHAIAEFDAAITLNPGDAMIYMERGAVYLDKREYDRATGDFDAATRLKPEHRGGIWGRGRAYLGKREWGRAAADFATIIQCWGADTNAYYNRGLAYFGLREYDRAISDFDAAIALNWDDVEAHFQRVCAYFAKREHGRAIARFNIIVWGLNPPDIDAYRASLRSFITKKFEGAIRAEEYEYAIACCNAAIQLDPNDATAYYHRALVYQMQGEYDHAIADYGAAIALDPDYAMAYLERGEVYLNRSQSEIYIWHAGSVGLGGAEEFCRASL